VKLTADTNILLRAFVIDDPQQSEAAQRLIADAELIAVPVIVLCELAWVLSRQYKASRPVIADVIRRLTETANVVTAQPVVEAGLALLEAGGDFADGVIAFEGNWLGAETFVTFDKRAARLIQAQGGSARLLTAPA
jgi:predicted nucleic-acid-binding protein